MASSVRLTLIAIFRGSSTKYNSVQLMVGSFVSQSLSIPVPVYKVGLIIQPWRKCSRDAARRMSVPLSVSLSRASIVLKRPILYRHSINATWSFSVKQKIMVNSNGIVPSVFERRIQLWAKKSYFRLIGLSQKRYKIGTRLL